MIVKTIFILFIYLVPFITLNTDTESSILLLFVMYVTSGLGIVMRILYDVIIDYIQKNSQLTSMLDIQRLLLGHSE